MTCSSATRRVGRCPAGSCLVPPGTVHTFANPADAAGRASSAWSRPAGFEQYFRDLRDASANGPPDPAVIREISSRYDIEYAPAD